MVRTASACPSPRWHRVFLSFLPQIVHHAKYAFRHLRGEARQDCIHETIANALVAFKALVSRGKMSLAYPTVLAKYATAQIKDGRRVGNSLNVREVLSPYAQKAEELQGRAARPPRERRRKRVVRDLIEDKHAGPAETAMCKDRRGLVVQKLCLAAIARSPSTSALATAPPTPPASSK